MLGLALGSNPYLSLYLMYFRPKQDECLLRATVHIQFLSYLPNTVFEGSAFAYQEPWYATSSALFSKPPV